MDILVTGANGQLGEELKNRTCSDKDNIYHFVDRKMLDITDYEKVDKYFDENKFDYVINCAAYTNVRKAEENVEEAFNINSKAVEHLAYTCKKYNSRLIHISTDYVFDGTQNTPYNTDSKTSPLNIYGLSKLDGENAIKDSNCNYMIIRTSWLYSIYGNNFVKTMMELFKKNRIINVVYDQVGCPTNASYLADFIYYIIINNKFKNGIYHFSNLGVASWYDFAITIYDMTYKHHEYIVEHILPTKTDDKIKRPSYSVMNCEAIKKEFDYDIPYWRTALHDCLAYLRLFH